MQKTLEPMVLKKLLREYYATAGRLLFWKADDAHWQLQEQILKLLLTISGKEEYYDAIRQGMYDVANSPMGTAYETFGNYPVKIAAKTGTAQMGEEKTNNAVFVCYAPYENPEIAICVAVEKGGAGSEVAMIAKNVLDYYFSFKNSTVTLETEMSLLK